MLGSISADPALKKWGWIPASPFLFAALPGEQTSQGGHTGLILLPSKLQKFTWEHRQVKAQVREGAPEDLSH